MQVKNIAECSEGLIYVLGAQKNSLIETTFLLSTHNIYCTYGSLIYVEIIAKCSRGEHSAILLTSIKLPFSIKTLVLSIFKRPFKTGFTVHTDSY